MWEAMGGYWPKRTTLSIPTADVWKRGGYTRRSYLLKASRERPGDDSTAPPFGRTAKCLGGTAAGVVLRGKPGL